jgi:hypothetical protein
MINESKISNTCKLYDTQVSKTINLVAFSLKHHIQYLHINYYFIEGFYGFYL